MNPRNYLITHGLHAFSRPLDQENVLVFLNGCNRIFCAMSADQRPHSRFPRIQSAIWSMTSMALFDNWLKSDVEDDDQKRLLKFVEKAGGRASIKAQLCQTVRSHYDSADRIAEDISDWDTKLPRKCFGNACQKPRKHGPAKLVRFSLRNLSRKNLSLKFLSGACATRMAANSPARRRFYRSSL